MPIGLNHAEICAKFDRLVSDGIIAYQPSKPVLVADKGMMFCFHVVQSLKNKPQAEDTISVAKPTSTDSHFLSGTFGPGSDILRDHPDVCITKVNDTHYLVINKFPVLRPMLLLLTVDSYRRQHEPLDLEDLDAGWQMMHAMEEEHYVFFNCTVTAGSSRAHKHLQVVPAPGHEGYPEGFRFFPDCPPGSDARPPPLLYFIQRFDELSGGQIKDSAQLLEIYSRLLQRARDALQLPESEAACPHNFAMTARWMIVIPRSTKDIHGVTANTPGMLGSVYISNQEQLDEWKAFGPTNVLTALGLPAQNS
ncbi:uncharacterized protein N7483_011864 [Penicillium malachiteum]|uniref:uncharacterized protein n=1 Tax=Penicillium malachiteum TaxID=1324776 RepID=UPI002548C41B|nr:uncharacterized protein N7483_011864 [Penicillium malachiteum]KAJ5714683.1 hypothetical protein N7483_011864 [Penicillium malachiteum]